MVRKEVKKQTLLKEEVNPEQIFNTLNSSIGGNTTNFMDYEGIKKLRTNNPEFFNKSEVKKLITKILSEYEDWKRLEKRYSEVGKDNLKSIKKLLTDEFGSDDLYYKIPKQLGY
jgi:macrodomain Ter protein organizer (MatP/YcbG family)